MRIAKTLAAFAGMALFFACSDDTTTVKVDATDESKTLADVAFNTLAAYDNELLDSVVVVELDSKAKQVSKNGRVLFEGLTPGEHLFRVSKNGYADLIVTVSMDHDASSPDMPILRDEVRTVHMYRAGLTVKGQVRREMADETHAAAENANVLLIPDAPMEGEWATTSYAAVTDKKGLYEFTDIPEIAEYTVTVEVHTDAQGRTWYPADVINAEHAPSDLVDTLTAVILTHDKPKYVIDRTNYATLGEKEAFKAVFSNPVDTVFTVKNPPIVANLTQDDTVAVTWKWSADGHVLSVSPLSGQWHLTDEYMLHVNGYVDAYGQALTDSVKFWVPSAGKLSKVSSFSLDSAFSSNVLFDNDHREDEDDCLSDTVQVFFFSWKTQKTAEKFRLYVQKADRNDYTLLDEIPASAADDDGNHSYVFDAVFSGIDVFSDKDGNVKFAVGPCHDLECLAISKEAVISRNVCD